MMVRLFTEGVISALMIADTHTALSLLQDHRYELQDPFAGPALQAEFLYFAIKKANKQVIQFLSKLNTGGTDIPFYHFCGDTPLGLAQKEGLQDMLPSLLPKTDKNFALMTAVRLKNNALVDLLLHSFPFKDKLLKYLNLKP